MKGLAGKLFRWKAIFDIGAWLVESLAKADQRVTHMARSFAVSKQQARLLYEVADVLFQKKAIAEINTKLIGNLSELDRNRMAL
jgi:hypothetical protein